MALTKVKGHIIADDLALGGNPTTSTQSTGNNTTRIATTAFVQTELAALVDSSPSSLNTLNELAAALGDDANFSTTVTNSIATKLPLAGGTMTGNITSNQSTFSLINNDIRFKTSGAETMLRAVANGAVEVMYDNSTKLATTSTGIEVTGITLSDGYRTAADNTNYSLFTRNSSNTAVYIQQAGSGNILDVQSGSAGAGQGTSRLFVKSDGNVGIGTSTPDRKLHLNEAASSTSNFIHLTTADTGTTGSNGFLVGIGSAGGAELWNYEAQPILFATSSSERMRIDSSGNLLVGTTSTTVGGLTSAGVGFRVDAANGILQTASNSNITAIFNRTNTDGQLISFRNAGTEDGAINTLSGRMGIGSGDTGLFFDSTRNCISPFTMTGNDGRSAAIDLGRSGVQFQHLHFSGGLYGGTEVQTNTVGVGAVASGGSVARNTSENDGIFWHTSKNDYAIYRTTGAWSGSYQQLKLDWDTGIILDGGTAYGKSGVHIHGNISMGDSTYSNFTSPNYPVHICADGYALMVESGTGYGHMGSNNTSYFHFAGNRNFYFDNRCEASGGFHTYSDENLKKEITVIPSALNKVAQMNGVTFKWKDAAKRGGGDSGKQFGVTAQNMLAVDSELPTKNIDPLYNIEDGVSADDEYYTMDYTRITPFLIEAVKELKTKLEAAEARITTLEG